jgi:hypothetical protein
MYFDCWTNMISSIFEKCESVCWAYPLWDVFNKGTWLSENLYSENQRLCPDFIRTPSVMEQENGQNYP